MFEQHFGLRENPFAAGHQSRFVYPSREHQEAIAHLRFGIENREPFVLITGEVGTGKTTALYDVLAEYESRAVVALITNSSLTRDELLEEICLRFGLAQAGQLSKPQAIVALERFLRQARARGHHAILILDEAQNLERDLLEEIRLLSNLEDQGSKLIQLFLVGQPELEEKLARTELRQLRQRITVFYRLSPLSLEDTEHYIHHRINVAGGHAISVFPADACREVHAITHGIPREINTVAAQAMLNAFVEDAASVRPDHVRGVERDGEFRSVLRGGAGGARISLVEETNAPAQATSSAPAQMTSSAPTRMTSSAPAQMTGAASAPEPIAPGPPPFHPAEMHAAPAATTQAPEPVASGPPPLHPTAKFETSSPGNAALAPPAAAAPAPSAAATPAPPTAAAPVPPAAAAPATPAAPAPPAAAIPPATGAPAGPAQSPSRRAGAVAPAGTAEAWGTWLSSLAQLPAQIDETLAETLGAAPATSVVSQAQKPASAASTDTPVRTEPQRVEPPLRAEISPAASAPPRTEPPRVEPPRAEPPRSQAVTPPSAPPRMEPAARAESAPRVEAVAPAPRYEPPPSAQSTAPAGDAARVRSAPTPANAPPGLDASSRAGELSSAAAPARDAIVADTAAKTAPRIVPAVPETTGSAPRTPRRLEFMEEEAPAEGAKTLRWLVVAGIIAVVAVGTVLGIRAWLGAAKNPQTAPASAVSTTTEVPTSTPTATTNREPGASDAASRSAAVPVPKATPTTTQAPPVSAPPVSPNHSASSAGAQPAGKSAGTTVTSTTSGHADATGTHGAAVGGAAAGGAVAGGATAGSAAASGAVAGGAAVSGAAAGAAPARSSTTAQGLFGIAVGTYLDEERANEEQTKLVASTSLPARVLTVSENDVAMYRIVLGSFESRHQAESAASSLIERGLVDEARVVPLSTATASKP